MIEYRFRVPSATVFTLYSYSKALEYRFKVPTMGSPTKQHTKDEAGLPEGQSRICSEGGASIDQLRAYWRRLHTYSPSEA
jgi:hypothetical protein